MPFFLKPETSDNSFGEVGAVIVGEFFAVPSSRPEFLWLQLPQFHDVFFVRDIANYFIILLFKNIKAMKASYSYK